MLLRTRGAVASCSVPALVLFFSVPLGLFRIEGVLRYTGGLKLLLLVRIFQIGAS